jgi:hypothetical protein
MPNTDIFCSYADGGIVREGIQGESAEGTYSTGVRISKASLRVRPKLTRLANSAWRRWEFRISQAGP